jgi:hypothetical protein
LDPEKQDLKPDEQFLVVLASMVRSECPSLTSVLSLTSSEMKEVEKNQKQLSQSELSLQMLKKWSTREEANCVTNSELFYCFSIFSSKQLFLCLYHITENNFTLCKTTSG